VCQKNNSLFFQQFTQNKCFSSYFFRHYIVYGWTIWDEYYFENNPIKSNRKSLDALNVEAFSI